MVCSCKKAKPAPELPSDLEWGPTLWTLLHTLAEKSGNSKKANAQQYAWTYLINNLHNIIPCFECREHFLEYKKSYPFPDILQLPYDTLRVSIRTWLWKLHEHVNKEKGIISDVSTDCLAELYGNVNPTQAYYNLKAVLTKFFKTNLISIIHWHVGERYILSIISSLM